MPKSLPLRDRSDGRLKGWPGGVAVYPVIGRVEAFRPARPGEPVQAEIRAGRRLGRWVYCKYCYCHTLPLVLREAIPRRPVTEMTICAACGAGLTPPEPVPD